MFEDGLAQHGYTLRVGDLAKTLKPLTHNHASGNGLQGAESQLSFVAQIENLKCFQSGKLLRLLFAHIHRARIKGPVPRLVGRG
ncbi:hypothetical protein BDW72DRAFT_186910 [Aspergillus terricola var. indicus]